MDDKVCMLPSDLVCIQQFVTSLHVDRHILKYQRLTDNQYIT